MRATAIRSHMRFLSPSQQPLRLSAVLAALAALILGSASAEAQKASWNGVRRENLPAVGNYMPPAPPLPARARMNAPVPSGPTPGAARVGRVPFNGNPSHGQFSGGNFSASRFGRSVTGIGRGRAGVRHTWQSFQSHPSTVIVAPTWGYGITTTPYVVPWTSWRSQSLSVYTTPVTPFYTTPVTPWNAHLVPAIAPLPGYNPGYGYASCFCPTVWYGGIGSACGILPGISILNVGYGTTGNWSPAAAAVPPAFVEPTPDFSAIVTPPPVDEAEPVMPDFSDQVAVHDEFSVVPVEAQASSLPDKVQSLRYQASGDDAFRRHDFPSAEVFYRTAFETAPERPASCLRLAFVSIAQQEFDEAAAWLKTGLDLPSDRTQAWIPWSQLYGRDGTTLMREHSDKLWDWVAERPLSTDRLLLAATFQKLREYDGTADELLQIVREQNQAHRVASLLAMIGSSRQSRSRDTVSLSLQPSLEALRTAEFAQGVSEDSVPNFSSDAAADAVDLRTRATPASAAEKHTAGNPLTDVKRRPADASGSADDSGAIVMQGTRRIPDSQSGGDQPSTPDGRPKLVIPDRD